ncbi:MAG: hypothetical protein CVU62_12160 [Deltaproteobacteria bacterium HGW-Deltaproteobacteria-2]|nr:MAG: hypothetical protein CVU62_12160 [Deltaproteobacteria bacterium HGW-Deltaproteobacteria-2]
MLIQDVFSAYKNDLQKVEKCINNNATSEIKLIPEVSHHLIDSGGKRFRPLLLLISSGLCGCRNESRFPMAAVRPISSGETPRASWSATFFIPSLSF